jgi:hypothetical protein
MFPSFLEMVTFLRKARAGQLEDTEYENLLKLMEKTFDAADYAQSYRKVSDSLLCWLNEHSCADFASSHRWG